MTDRKLIQEILGLKEAWFIQCDYTRMPYVECSGETQTDEVFLFAEKADADAFCESRREKGPALSVQKLETVPLPHQPGKAVSGVLNFISSMPAMDVDVMSYKNARMDAPIEIDDSELLPADFFARFNDRTMFNPVLTLNALFFCQQVRLPVERQDPEELKLCEEDFSSSLAESSLLVPIIPPEDQPAPQNGQIRLDLKKCRFPTIKAQNGDVFLPVFTDRNEMGKYLRGRKIGCIQLPFNRLHNCFIKDGRGYLINPAGIALPLLREQMEPLCRRFGLVQEPLNRTENT